MSVVEKPVFKASVRYGGGGWRKNSGSLSVKIPAKVCPSKVRDELFVKSTMEVVLSLNPESDARSLPGMENEYPQQQIVVKVNQYSTNDSDISFSMSFDSNAMDASFLKMISNAPGSLYVLSVTLNEDKVTVGESSDSGYTQKPKRKSKKAKSEEDSDDDEG